MKQCSLRLLTILLTMALLLGSIAGCGSTQTPETTGAAEPAVSRIAKEKLDGKKIIFVGNSYTFWGHAVLQKGYSILDQETRTGDHGLFYQLCKAMGAEVSVTNWCFGAHDLTDMLCEPCQRDLPCKDVVHFEHITDRSFDYVVLQPYVERNYAGELNLHLQPMLEFFQEANPDVKFLLAVPHMAWEKNYVWVKDLETLDRSNIIVCNWGRMLHEIANGTVQVPGAKQPYARPTFVVSASAEDGHHQNMLGGYLTVAMVYSAITGQSAVGLPYDFCDDAAINSKFDLESYQQQYYVYEPYTNFVEVFRSQADMQGLQQLIDVYLKEENNTTKE